MATAVVVSAITPRIASPYPHGWQWNSAHASPVRHLAGCVCKQECGQAVEQIKASTVPIVTRRIVLQAAALACGVAVQDVARAGVEEDSNEISVTERVFFDVAIDGQPAGRIVVGLYGDAVPVGARRFGEIAVGQRGISYRRKDFYKVTPAYIQNAGLRSFSLSGGVADAARFTGGENSKELVAEMEELERLGKRLKNVKGAVSIVAKDGSTPAPDSKLVARNGKLVMVEEAPRPDPNGTEFMILANNAPELDSTNLVVGRVVEGMDVVQKIAAVKVVQENTSSPYFQAAKLIGDSRVIVAERGFNRPYSKITITKCGQLS